MTGNKEEYQLEAGRTDNSAAVQEEIPVWMPYMRGSAKPKNPVDEIRQLGLDLGISRVWEDDGDNETIGLMVSVIIPFMQGEHFLKDCFDSLYAQTFDNYEVVLVLDNYEGDISDFLKPYTDRIEVHVFKLEGKTGVAAARNLGIENSRGKYIYFLDSDDYIFEEAIGKLVDKAERLDADVVYGKKHTSWYKREIFLPTFIQQLEERRLLREAELEAQDSEEAEDADDSDEAEDSAENDGSSGEDDNGNESDNDSDESEGEESLSDEEREQQELLEQEYRRGVRRMKKRAFTRVFGKKRRIKNVSVLHILFRRELINQNRIRFNESFKYYSDIPFLLRAFDKAEVLKRSYARYIKRRHNDPINFPALSQIRDDNRFGELLDMYYYSILTVEPFSLARKALDGKMIHYYTGYYAPKLRRSENEAWKTDRFEALTNIARTLGKRRFSHMKHYSKKLMKTLWKGDLKKSMRIVNKHLAWKKIKRSFKKKHELGRYMYRHKYLDQPILDNYIMCESFFGKNYSDSPRNLYEYISTHFPGKFTFVWVLDNNTKLPYGGIKVKRFSMAYMKYLARSKYFIFNGRQPVWFKKREGMIFLETWHGTPLKKLVFDLEEVYSASPLYKKEVFSQSRKWDYLIAANKFSSDVFRSCFRYSNTMLEYGYPRNDILHSPGREELAAELKRKLKIPEGKKTILYAPTWRDDEFYAKGQYKFTLQLDLRLMRERLGKDYVVLLRTHYFIADQIDVTGVEDFAMNFSKYNDISELYLISDIIITDYSSVFFDYDNLRRPMLFFTYHL